MASPSTTPSAPIAAEVVPVAEGTPAAVLPPLGSMASLYVGDLAETVDEPQLHALFSQVAPVATVRVCRDILSGVSLGYGYVNFYSRQEATRALEALNFTPLIGKYIRVMFSNRDPSLRKSGRANLFVKNLEPNIDSKNLYEIFSSFGAILSCKVATDSAGQSKGYGFVQYETEESAEAAINGLNGMLANNRKMFVGLHMRRRDREVKFTNVYIKNLPTEFSEDDLRQEFAPFGEITSAVVMRDADGASKCFGFVNFKKPEFAIEAVEKANGKAIGDKTLYVGRAQKKEERKAELKTRFGRGRDNKVDKPNGINLYLKNIDDGINDEGLKKLFEEFGQVASCKVMVDARGRSKGSGFVSFATAEAGQRAINRMNGRIVGKKPLYVGLAQPKEERKAMLMAHFAQRNLAMAASQYAGPQQVYFGHPSSPGPIAPPQGAVFGFPQHFVPGMGPISPVMMPPHNMQRPRYPGPAPYRQQQAMIHANANHMPNARPGPYPAMPPQAFPGAGATAWQQHAVSRTTTAVASAGPADQHQILGNKLYALVEQLERDHAGKVTGMLLEMDKAEILQLLRSPEALRAKVREAMAVLQRTKAGGSVDPAAAAAVAKAGDSAADPPPAAAAAAAAVKAGSSADPGAAAAAPTVNA
ncbi:Polyadenylate-binding protein 5 [Zea mays]|uniref:Polyadenylate-binding protein n=1 Tax=Zea mays TaxID=4577 RepID=K7WAC5_MAIZE|nr:Polyadenylate-binding protein 5 [Zea mays]AQL04381.1 Polyadenylate-binding protein 3 [Zea mays]|eukprot:XP_008658882.2 uncharacterized protein LOC100383542 isoform X1 [Zea mays]